MAMTVAEAVRVFKDTQPQLDAMKDAERANKRAREVLKDHFHSEGITRFRGIELSETEATVWDSAALEAELGDRADQYRRLIHRAHFKLVGRARKTAA